MNWTSTPPAISGRYKYRHKDAPQHERDCDVTVYDDGSREIHDQDGDTVDTLGNYEFKGPVK